MKTPQERGRELLALLDDTTTQYHVKLIEEPCGQQHILPGALLEVTTTDGDVRPAFYPFIDLAYALGDHTVIHVNRED